MSSRLFLKMIGLFFIVLNVVAHCAASISPLTGVLPELESLYSIQRNFQCLDGSKIIPFLQVNDDYCDCPDGSDEPGTEACYNGIFYCANEGHTSKIISSSRVNDGICDCCDGSDEWKTLGCENNCQELGDSARKEAELKAAIIQQGIVLKQSLIEESKEIKVEHMNKLKQVESSLETTKSLLEEKQQIKLEAENVEKELLDIFNQKAEESKKLHQELEREREKEEVLYMFRELDTNQDGKISKLELITNELFDQNQDGQVNDEEVAYYLAGQEEYSLADFQETGWILMKPVLLKEKAEDEEGKSEISDDEYFDYSNSNNEEDEESFDEANEDQSDEPTLAQKKYDEITQQAVDKAEVARTEFENVNREIRELEKEVDSIRSILDRNYGQNNEYMSLSNKCFEYTDAEYTYKICLFEDCTQRKKHGGSETRLGTFQRWEQIDDVDVMYFTGGQQCWNGPARSTTVKISCGLDVKVLSTHEPSKCEYEVLMESPTACQVRVDSEQNHDEL